MVDFLVIGPLNAVNYDNVFVLMVKEIAHISWNFSTGGHMCFYRGSDVYDIQGMCWFNNMMSRYSRGLKLVKHFDSSSYEVIDNTDIINVDDIRDIPSDYFGVMGVSMGFFIKWDPRQFEVLGIMKGNSVFVNGKKKYVRILIKRK